MLQKCYTSIYTHTYSWAHAISLQAVTSLNKWFIFPSFRKSIFKEVKEECNREGARLEQAVVSRCRSVRWHLTGKKNLPAINGRPTLNSTPVVVYARVGEYIVCVCVCVRACVIMKSWKTKTDLPDVYWHVKEWNVVWTGNCKQLYINIDSLYFPRTRD